MKHWHTSERISNRGSSLISERISRSILGGSLPAQLPTCTSSTTDLSGSFTQKCGVSLPLPVILAGGKGRREGGKGEKRAGRQGAVG